MSAARLLVVGGVDSSRGAGLDADLEAARAMGVEIDAVATADTEQDERGVRAVDPRDARRWLAEALAAARRREPAAVKLGLLPGAPHVAAACELTSRLFARRPDVPVVVDPVIAASSGYVFLGAAAVRRLAFELLAGDVIATPNLPEAARLSGRSPDELADPAQRLLAASELLARGARAIVLKGGHGDEDPLLDLVAERGAPPHWLELRRRPGPGIRGSGCRHATALAAGLALGRPLVEAARDAAELVAERIAAAVR